MSVLSRGGTQAGMSTGKVALAIVLLSETVFFGTLLAAYAAARAGSPIAQMSDPARLVLPAANTLILLMSVLPARLAARGETRGGAIGVWLAVTFLLGSLFVVGQVFEFSRSGMRVDDGALGGEFFVLMGFHALHIVAGMLVIAINLGRERLGDFSKGSKEALEIGSLFWYYVVAIWVVLFGALYLV